MTIPHVPFALLSTVHTSAIVTFGALAPFLVGALAVEIRQEIGVSEAMLGVAVGAFSLSSAVASGSAGKLVERIGWRQGLRACGLLTACLFAALALLVSNSLLLVLFLLLGGLAYSLAHPSANLGLTRMVETEHHGLAFGTKHAAVPLAVFLAGLAVPAASQTGLGWRNTFFCAAVMVLTLSIVAPRRDLEKRTEHPQQTGSRVGFPKQLVVLAIAATLGIFGATAMGAFLVLYEVEKGISQSFAGILLACGSLLGVLVRILAGIWVDRTNVADLKLITWLLATGGTAFLLMTIDHPASLSVTPLLAFAGSWGWSGLLTYSVVRRYPEAPAAATAIVQSGIFAGATFGPAIFGAIASLYSFNVAWIIVGLMALIAAALVKSAARMHGV